MRVDKCILIFFLLLAWALLFSLNISGYVSKAKTPLEVNNAHFIGSLCFHERKTVTPENYGAKGDGIADDTHSFLEALRSGYPVRCDGYYRLNKESLPVDDKGNPIFPTIKKRIVVSGKGTVHFDFHINVSGIIEVGNIKLFSTGTEPNGLFSILKTGKASFRNVIFDGTSGDHVSGGVASRGELSIIHCTFLQSDVNIIAPKGSFSIKKSVFDGYNANNPLFLSNELIHIQSCNFGVIDSCIFRNSLQDIVDFYYGAKNVVFENNEVYNNSSTLFEIKAEYRNPDNQQGGNQVYNDHTENIIIRNNSFRVSNTIAWVGTRSDNRTDSSFEDGYYVRNVEFYSNRINVIGGKNVDLWYARNIKSLSIRDNVVQSDNTPIFVLRVMEGNEYELCENVHLERNVLLSPNITLLYLSGNVSDIHIKDNNITHNSQESYLVLSSKKKKSIGEVTIEDNIIKGDFPMRFCTTSIPLICNKLKIANQKVKAFYLDTIKEVTFLSCESPIVYQSGKVKDYAIHSCSKPLIVSQGYYIRNLYIQDTDIKQSPTFVSNKEGIIENAYFNNVKKKIQHSEGVKIIRTENK